MAWDDGDRGPVLALLAERKEKCPQCGHPMSVCRDQKTAGTWQAEVEVCQPSVVAQVRAEQIHEAKQRGRVIMTRRTAGGG